MPGAISTRSNGLRFNEKQRKVAVGLAQGLGPNAAAKQAGYAAASSIRVLIDKPQFQALVAQERRKFEEEAKMNRKKVLDGFIEAIDMARLISDPHAMIKGWTEIGKLCGYYAPEVRKIDVSISAKRLIDKLEVMSDDELLQLAEKNGQIIEIEAEREETPALEHKTL